MRRREEPSVWQVRYHPLDVLKAEIFYLKAMGYSDANGEFIRWWTESGRTKKLWAEDFKISLLVDGNEIINPERVP